MVLADRLWGLLWALFGLGVFWRARSFPKLPGQAYGSALMPEIVGAGLVLCGLLLIVSDLRAMKPTPLVRLHPGIATVPRLLDMGAVIVGLALFILFTGRIGFPVTATLVTGGLIWRFRRRGMSSSFALALVAVLLVDWMFRSLLLVPLPLGPLPPPPW